MPNRGGRIENPRCKLKVLKSKQLRTDGKLSASASRLKRTDDTRRKTLIGATTFARIDSDRLDCAELELWRNAHRARDDDRAPFKVAPKSALRCNGNIFRAATSVADL